jgi:hypothetical protein
MSNYTLDEQKEHRKAWVAALRSGKYKQGTEGFLRDSNDNYCCLGVACELAGVEAQYQTERMCYRYGPSLHIGHEALFEYFGLRNSSVGSFYNESNTLAYLNDNGWNFSQIADLIESEPAGLFVSV